MNLKKSLQIGDSQPSYDANCQHFTHFTSIVRVIPSNVHKKENRLVNRLANEAMAMEISEIMSQWESLESNQLKDDCNRIYKDDKSFPYGDTIDANMLPPMWQERTSST
jgi:hypothetical protein